jgi:hypothetical protein
MPGRGKGGGRGRGGNPRNPKKPKPTGANYNGANNGGYGGGGSQYTAVGANSGQTLGQEKVLRIQVENGANEGYFGQSIGFVLTSHPAARAQLVQWCKTMFPQIIANGWSPQPSNAAMLHMNQLQMMQGYGVGAYGNPHAAPNLQFGQMPFQQNSTSAVFGQNPQNVHNLQSLPPQTLQIGHMTTRDSTGKTVTSLPIDTIATLVGQNTILGADIELWCKVSKVDPAALYNRVAKNAREKLRLNAEPGFRTPIRNVHWSDGAQQSDEHGMGFSSAASSSFHSGGSAASGISLV